MDTAADNTLSRIELRDIKKSFGAVQALQGVNISLAPGEVLGLVGDNGAGKSTLMKILSGAQAPDSGSILLDGKEVRFSHPRDARAEHIEMVYQDLSLCEELDVAGNLFLGREPRWGGLWGFVDRRKMHREAAEALDSLGIRIQYTDVPVANLSGGQRQSVAIGRALSFNPRVLILDEPTAALAVKEVEQVLELTQEVASTGVSVILITHRLQDLFKVCDRIAVMYEGTNVADLDTSSTSMEQLVQAIVGGGAEAA
ncbi:ATP-binding cassette domain-containing protein [Rubrobacter aplysinae]|uniref:ATP-binding cassette domain-containing protein n=1 Tax=Rubrobacter aplysinae TaxID=909625 RepID=UPI00064C1CD3|nr:ATP-binding cassette domain-containing protein [Rubrobacter aplysinae]